MLLNKPLIRTRALEFQALLHHVTNLKLPPKPELAQSEESKNDQGASLNSNRASNRVEK